MGCRMGKEAKSPGDFEASKIDPCSVRLWANRRRTRLFGVARNERSPRLSGRRGKSWPTGKQPCAFILADVFSWEFESVLVENA
jgi:hypothetical protein